VDLVEQVRDTITIPLAVKIAPFFTTMTAFARRLEEVGANGLVLFNRFVHPDIDLEKLEYVGNLQLSTTWEVRLPLMWIALLRGRVGASLAASTGMHGFEDMLKLLLAGADVTMTASAVLRNGPRHVAAMLEGLRRWMDEHEYSSVEQLKGSMSQEHCPDPSALERVNYMRTITSYSSKT
jgi:dihydroorotate dehydrogenase (fumarate)